MIWGIYEGFHLLFDQLRHHLDHQTRKGLRSLPPIETPMAFIIGVGMAGTATLFDHLNQHPHTIPCVTREAKVFLAGNEPDIADYSYCHLLYYAHLYAIGQLDLSDNPERELVAEFLNFARHCHRFAVRRSGYDLPTDGRMVAIDQDLSLTNPGGPEALQRYNPNAKLLVVLRDPVETAYSIYKRCKNGLMKPDGSYGHVLLKREFKSFEEVLNTDERALSWYLGPGIYVRFLKQWLEVFPTEQIMVIGNDEMRSNCMEVIAKVFEFIDVPRKLVPVDRFDMEIASPRDHNDTMNPDTREKLAAFFHPYNEELFQLIGRRFDWSTPGENSDQVSGRESVLDQDDGHLRMA